MYLSILRLGMLLTLAALGVPAAAQPELFFAAGVDSTGWAQARSNADGHVLIESPQYPRGLWLHWVNDAGDALAGLQVEYQERPDSLVVIRCVDPAGKVRETLIWTRPEGDALRLTLQPKEGGDLPAGLASIDWQIAPSVEDLLEPVVEIRRIGWEAVASFLKARWQSRAGRVAVQFNARTLAIEVDYLEDVETLVAHLQQAQQPADAALGATNPLAMQIFAGNLGLQEGVILYVPLLYDPNLEGVVREALRRPQGRLTSEDFASLIEFRANSNIRSLAGIEYFAGLSWLELSGNRIVDLTPISQLNSLEYLDLSGNRIVDLTPISQLNSLSWLELSGNRIVDLTPISQLKNLYYLNLSGNQIDDDDLTLISQLNSLRSLELSGNRIVDLTPISQLKNLYYLNLSGNQIDDDDLTLISQLNLQHLELSGNQIVDLTLISQLNSLEYLDLSSNRIVDLTPISQLQYLKRLDLSGNPIVDLTPISQLKNLYALVMSDSRIVDLTPISQLKYLRGLWLSGSQIDDDDLTLIGQLHLYDLDLSGNRIVDLTLINEIKYLQRLFLSNNRIEDVSPLAKLTYLRDLRLSTNRIEDISPLAELTRLRYLHLMSNPLSDQALTEHIPALEARGVTVHY